MKNYIKAFLATGIGMAMMKLVAENEKDKIEKFSSPTSLSSLIFSSEEETK